jgi:hypothetical protein
VGAVAPIFLRIQHLHAGEDMVRAAPSISENEGKKEQPKRTPPPSPTPPPKPPSVRPCPSSHATHVHATQSTHLLF